MSDDAWVIREGDGPETIERKMGHREIARLDRAARRHEFGRPGITELEIGSKTHRVAEVEPMDVDGVRTMTVGTIVWGVIAVALIPFLGALEKDGGSTVHPSARRNRGRMRPRVRRHWPCRWRTRRIAATSVRPGSP